MTSSSRSRRRRSRAPSTGSSSTCSRPGSASTSSPTRWPPAASSSATSPRPPSSSRVVETMRAHGELHRAAAVGDPGARLARRGPRGPPAAQDDRPHRLPGHRAPDGAGRHAAAARSAGRRPVPTASTTPDRGREADCRPPRTSASDVPIGRDTVPQGASLRSLATSGESRSSPEDPSSTEVSHVPSPGDEHGSRRAAASAREPGRFLEAEVARPAPAARRAPAQLRVPWSSGCSTRSAPWSRVTAQNERLGADPARGPRPDHDPQGGGRPAGPAAGRLRHLPRAATTTTPSTSSPAAASCG